MAAEKAGKLERDMLIREIEKRHGVKLRRVKPYSKWLQDQTGKNFCVLVGNGLWHGIPEKLLEAERDAQAGGILVVAVKNDAVINVYVGPLEQVVKAAKVQYGEYKFNCKERSTYLTIQEIPGFTLKKSFALPFGKKEKETQKKISEFKNVWASSSPEERKEIARVSKAQPGAL